MKQASLLRRIGTYLLGLVDEYWAMRLERGTKALMLEAAKALTADQALTAYAMASELMRSDGPIQQRSDDGSICWP